MQSNVSTIATYSSSCIAQMQALLYSDTAFHEVTPLRFFHSLFRIDTEYFMQILKMWNAAEHAGVTPNMFLHLVPT